MHQKVPPGCISYLYNACAGADSVSKCSADISISGDVAENDDGRRRVRRHERGEDGWANSEVFMRDRQSTPGAYMDTINVQR